MVVYVNNKHHEIPADTRIEKALELLHITSRNGIAIAVNNDVIPKGEWETHTLHAEDKMMLIKATQGG